MVFMRGEGAELRVPLALTVIGGLTISTLLTLVVVPLFYLEGKTAAGLVAAPVATEFGSLIHELAPSDHKTAHRRLHGFFQA